MRLIEPLHCGFLVLASVLTLWISSYVILRQCFGHPSAYTPTTRTIVMPPPISEHSQLLTKASSVYQPLTVLDKWITGDEVYFLVFPVTPVTPTAWTYP